ncbi:MAG: radical SAM protein [Pseudomonadales bacterium]|nr:radical SAM protein [Pseudomonadales bacterium]
MDKEKQFSISRAVYGPVKSWRFGSSLGIDLLFVDSICSFNCVYCQLGNIQNHTNERKVYVSTKEIIQDFKAVSKNKPFDIITYSGNGEPTLASNLKETIISLRALTPVPQSILTNGTTLLNPDVIDALCLLDKVSVKLDAGSEAIFSRINRPVDGCTLQSVMDGIDNLKKKFNGELEVQSMFCNATMADLDNYISLLNKIKPDKVQLNMPTRPYPREWHRENRGNHLQAYDYPVSTLKKISRDNAEKVLTEIREKTGLDVQSNSSFIEAIDTTGYQ